MKNIVRIVFTVIIGSLLGFFGVLVSVFTDSSTTERMITIAVILLIYSILSGLSGLLIPKYSWQWGLILSSPGVLMLGLYMLNEFNFLYIIYIILIIGLSCLSAKIGSNIRRRNKNKK